MAAPILIVASVALNLAPQSSGPLLARFLTRAYLSKPVFRWLHLLRWPTRQQNSREGVMLTYCVSNRMPVTVSQLGTTCNPLTSNTASEGRRSAQHGGVPSTGWLGDEARPVSKPTGLHDAEG